MVSPGLVALAGEGVAQAEGQVVLLGGKEAGRGLAAGHVGVVAHAEGVLAVGGVGAPGTVVVFKEDAVGGQLVEGGGALGVDELAGEGLGADGDEVVALQHAGIFVLLRGLLGGKVAVEGFKGFVGGGFLQRGKVDVQDIILRGVHVVVGGAQGDGELRVLVSLGREEHVLALQAGGGEQADVVDAHLGAGTGGGVQAIDRIGAVAAGGHHRQGAEVEQHKGCHGCRGTVPPELGQGEHALGRQDDGSHRRREKQEHHGHGLPDAVKHLMEEIHHGAGAHAELGDGHKLAEDGVVDQLNFKIEGHRAEDDAKRPLPHSGRQDSTQRKNQRAGTEAEENGEDNPLIDLLINAKMEHHFEVNGHQQRQHQGEPFFARRKEPFAHHVRLFILN